EDLDGDLNGRGISLVFAEMKDPLRSKIQRYQLTRTLNPIHFFPTLTAAYKAFREPTGSDWQPRPTTADRPEPRSGRPCDGSPAGGIAPIVLRPGDDLLRLAEDAIARGSDVIGMAGGDGSQALIATVASQHGVPHVVVPAGTRNHFALDLGIDRNDVVGAL